MSDAEKAVWAAAYGASVALQTAMVEEDNDLASPWARWRRVRCDAASTCAAKAVLLMRGAKNYPEDFEQQRVAMCDEMGAAAV